MPGPCRRRRGGESISYQSSSPLDGVAAGASCSVIADVLGNATGELGNTTGDLTSTVGGQSRSSGKAAATLTVTVESITLTKAFVGDPVAPGGTVSLELTVLNLDRRSAATDIAFTDDLDAALSGLTATGLPAAGVCGSGFSLDGTGFLSVPRQLDTALAGLAMLMPAGKPSVKASSPTVDEVLPPGEPWGVLEPPRRATPEARSTEGALTLNDIGC